MNRIPLRVLVVEDSEFDARILISVLRKGGYEPAFERVETSESMRTALQAHPWDLVLADYNMPAFSAPEALKLVQESNMDVPFIIVSGGIGEDIAVAAMKAGAHDYLMKGNLARLVPAVERELRDASVRSARRQAEEAMRESELRYRLLWENSADAVLMINPDGIIWFANPTTEKIFGYTAAETMGRPFLQLLAEPFPMELQSGVLALMQRDAAELRRCVLEAKGRTRDGKELILGLAFNELEIHQQRWLVAFIRDVTEARRAEAELRESEEQFRVAREIQQRLFPKTSPSLPGFDIAGVSHPAEAAGGDYFDFLPMLHEHWGFVVGDVTGHGVGPALLMAETRAYLRILARNREDVGEIMERANRMLGEDVGSERFVTLLLVKLHPDTRMLVYSNAGHPAGYVLSPDGAVRATLKRTGMPLGINPEATYDSAPPLLLASGEVTILLTDGVDEAMSPEDDFFGTERALEVVRKNREKPAAEIVEALYREVRAFSRNTPQHDDFTVIVIKVL